MNEVPEDDTEDDKSGKAVIVYDSAINIGICSYSDISNDVRKN